MALPASGNSISLDQMHTEVWSTSGSLVSLNDADIRGMIFKSSQAQMSFSEWYGVTPPIGVTYVNKYDYTGSSSMASTTTMSLSGLSSNPTTLVVGAHWMDKNHTGLSPSAPTLAASGGYTVTDDLDPAFNDDGFDEKKYLRWHRVYIGTATSVTLTGTRGGFGSTPAAGGWRIWECTGNLQLGATSKSSSSYSDAQWNDSGQTPGPTATASINANERDVVFVSTVGNANIPSSISNVDSGSQVTGNYSRMGYDTRGSGDSGSVTYSSSGFGAGGGIAAVRYYLS